MKKRMMFGALALATAGLIAAFASSASALPTKTTDCSVCHSGKTLAVTATETANNGTTATYDVNASGATVVAVFDGATKIGQVTGATGSITVPVGKTYVLQAIAGPTTTDGWGSTSVSPVATTPTPTTTDTVTPVTTATPDPTGTPTPDATGTATVRIHVMNAHGPGAAGVTVTLTNALTGTAVAAITDSHGRVTFSNLTKGTYTVSVTLSNGHVLTGTFRVGHDNRTITLKDHKAHADKHGAKDAKHGHDAVKTVAKSHTTHGDKAVANSHTTHGKSGKH